MTLLVRHPSTPAGAVHTVDADLERVAGGVVATFRVSGDLSRLVLPEPAAAGRADDLWKTTCFELFVEGEGATYREFNFSPSTRCSIAPKMLLPSASSISMRTRSPKRMYSVTALP